MVGARWCTGLASLVVSSMSFGSVALGQQTSGPAPQASAEPACYPACREGYACARGQCVSLCNPPCPSGQICVEGRRCEAAPADEARYPEPPAPPPPKSVLDRSHDMIGLHLGLGGSDEVNDSSEDLATTYGVNFRADYPVVRYILLGPMVQFAAWRQNAGNPTPTRNYIADIDFYLRGRVPIDLGAMGAQFWAGIPVGLTLSFLRGDRAEVFDDVGPGWNIGVLLGGAIHFTRKFGLFVEVGWMQHKMSHGSDAAGVPDADFRLSQTNLNLGFVL